MKKRFDNLITISITATILIVLVFSGTAQAFILSMDIPNKIVNLGEKISFIVLLELDAQEILNVSNFILELSGPEAVSCKFLPSGEIVSGCNGISIEKVSIPDIGYGYGFSNGSFKYNLILDSANYLAGEYTTKLIVIYDKNQFEKYGDNIFIVQPTPMKKCSVRAKGGKLKLGDIKSSNNKINFYVSPKSAGIGNGYIIAQANKQRIVYNFGIKEVLENNKFSAKIAVSGSYKINTEKEIKEDAIIFLDKKNKKVSIESDSFSFTNGIVSFIDDC